MKISKKRLREIIQEELVYDRNDESADAFEDEDIDPFEEEDDEVFDDHPAETELVYRGMRYSLPEDPGLRQAAQQEMERLINAFFNEEV